MPNHKNSHDENRSKVCLLCFQKGSSMKSLVPSKEILKRVQNFFIENYDPSDLKMPAGLCSSCRLKLNKKEQKSKGERLPIFEPWQPNCSQSRKVKKARKRSKESQV